MSEQNNSVVQDLFQAAIKMPAEQREEWLAEQCGDNQARLHEVLELLKGNRLEADPMKDGVDRPLPADAGFSRQVEPEGLHVRCPHCRNPVELVDDAELSDVVCESCGSSFSLIAEDATKSHVAGKSSKIAHFELIERVGIGAFGSVFKARDTQLDRIVAIKVPRKGQLTGEEAEKFLREARTAAQLKHPNIVAVHEVGRDDDRVFIVSDFVEGVTLSDWLTGARPSHKETVELCVTIVRAIQYAHSQGVIHRDLKPGNIMLDRNNQPFLMDFGLAKREAGEITMTVEGQVLGTPAYMSPEQARGDAHAVDGTTDLYAMGVILFEMLTGERPFRGNQRMLLHQVLTEDAPSPRRLDSTVPKDLETISLRCLAKEPSRRFGSADELADDLQRYLKGEPIHARRISQFERSVRWIRRHPAWTTAISAAVLAAVSIAVLAVFVMLKNRELDEFNQSLKIATAAETKAKEKAEAQRIAAEKALDEADRQAAIAASVSDFFQNDIIRQTSSFAQAHRHDVAIPDLTLREALDRASERIGDRFSEQELSEAAIRQTIGEAYQSLGEYSQGVLHLERCIALRESLLEPDHAETLKAKYHLAGCCWGTGDLWRAIRLCDEILDIQTSKLGSNHIDTIDTALLSANCYRSAGKPKKALDIAKSTLEVAQEEFGAKHRTTLRSMAEIASCYLKLYQTDRALPLLEEALQLSQDLLGPHHPATLYRMKGLANGYGSAGKVKKAIALLEETLRLQQKYVGPEHHASLITMSDLATYYSQTGRLDLSMPMTIKTQQSFEKQFGRSHPHTLSALQNLAVLQDKIGDTELARKLESEIFELKKARLGPEHPSTLQSMSNLAVSMHKQGNTAQALPLVEQVLKIR